MPSYRKLRKRWLARVRLEGIRHNLGYYATRAEAESVEHDFLFTYCGPEFKCRHPYCKSRRTANA